MSQIITLDDLTTYSSGTTIDPGLGQQVVDAVNAYIETYTGRCIGETKQIVSERYDWQQTVWLRHADIVSVDEVETGWPGQSTDTLTSESYYLNELGRITFFSWGSWSRPIRDYLAVTYTYGVAVAPDDLRLAALGIAQGFYQASENGQQDVSEVQVGSYRIKYGNSSQSGSTGSTRTASDNNWAVIDSYKLRRV